MQKISLSILVVFTLLMVSCNSENKTLPVYTIPQDSTLIFPVTDFLIGQINEIDTLPVTPLKTTSINDKTDSIWIKREEVRTFATPFLSPVIDSASMDFYFTGKSFLDATLNLFTLTYDPRKTLPDDIALRHWDVYIDPVDNKVQRIYLVKEDNIGGEHIITQLTWYANEWCSIRTIIQKPTGEQKIKEEKVTWNFR